MSRKYEYNWVFGHGAHIEFQNGTDIIVHPKTPMDVWEGCASISDPNNGELLFYTDGHTLWDANHAPLFVNLGSNASTSPMNAETPTHGALIIPPPTGGTYYHVIATATADPFEGPSNDLIHSTYDVSGSGTGVLIQQMSAPTPLFGNIETTERVAAVHNASRTGFWVLTQETSTNDFKLVSISSDTPTVEPTQVNPHIEAQDFQGEFGVMKFSPDGSMLAYMDGDSLELVVFDFDNATGILTYRFRIFDIGHSGYGLEFSPDSQMIYYSTQNSSYDHIYQAPVGTVDVSHTGSLLLKDGNNGSNPARYAGLQTGPDGKIYVSRMTDNFLSVITAPNVPGVGCGFQDLAVDMSGDNVEFAEIQHMGLPSFVQLCHEPETKDMDLCCLFPWFSTSNLNHHSTARLSTEPVVVYSGSFNNPGPDLSAHQSLSPLSANAQLVDISVFKNTANFPAFTGTIDFSLVVLDFQGNLLRTISTANIDFQTAPDATWIPVTLSTDPIDTTILAGEVVAGQMVFGSTPNPYGSFPYNMTGRGRFV